MAMHSLYRCRFFPKAEDFSLTNDPLFQCSFQRKFGDASRAGALLFRQLCHHNCFLLPVADDGFIYFKFSCCCSVTNFICMSHNFKLIPKSETLTCEFNTGHFDSKLLVATLMVKD